MIVRGNKFKYRIAQEKISIETKDTILELMKDSDRGTENDGCRSAGLIQDAAVMKNIALKLHKKKG